MFFLLGLIACLASLLSTNSAVQAGDKTELLSETPLGGLCENIAYGNGVCYVAKHTGGIDVIDVVNPLAPYHLTTIDPDGPNNATVNIWDVQVLNTTLYAFNRGLAIDPSPGKGNWTGVYMYDVSNPASPVEVGAIVWGAGPGYHFGAYTESGEAALIAGVPHLFICSSITTMVEIFDVSNPAIPVYRSTVMRPQWKPSLQTVYQNGLLYTAWGTEGFTIDDVSDPNNPVRLGRQVYTGAATPQGGLRTLSPTPDGQYVVTGEYTSSGDVRLWNVSNPSAITQVASWRLGTGALLWNVKATQDYAYVAHLEDGIRILDIRSRTGLVPAGSYDPDPATPLRDWSGISDIAFDGRLMFACHETRGLFCVLHDPNQPPPDVVQITTATYKTSQRELKVYATSSQQPTPSLTVRGLGTMTWNRRQSRYELVVTVPTAPTSVTVDSSARGTATRPVTVTR